MKVIYIAGWGRSGSTILANVLNEIDDCIHIGEFCYVWENAFLNGFACGCGTPVLKCPFWAEVFREVFGNVDPLPHARRMIQLRRTTPSNADILLGRTSATDPSQFAEYRSITERLYHAMGAVANAEVVVDSSKNPYHLFLLSTIASLDVHVVHLIRDPRATAYSWMRKRLRQDAGADRSVQMETFAPVKNSRKWTVCNLTIGSMRDRFAGYQRVRYEDFAADPEHVIGHLQSQFGLSAPNPVNGRTVHLHGNHTVWGNPKRTATGDVQIQADVEWASQMPALDRARASILSWPLMKYYGY